MSKIHFFVGEKGGVGKSFAARSMIEYYQKKYSGKYEIFDLDTPNFDVGLLYSPEHYLLPESNDSDGKDQDKEQGKGQDAPNSGELLNGSGAADQNSRRLIYFTEDRRRKNSVDRIIELAINEKKDIIVNTPANTQRMMINWFKESNLVSLLTSHKIIPVFWFVSNGSSSSFDSLLALLAKFKETKAKVVLVRNLHNLEEDEWTDIFQGRGASIKSTLDEAKVTYFSLPGLDYNATFALEGSKMTFSQFRDGSQGTILDRQRVSTFLSDSFEKFDACLATIK